MDKAETTLNDLLAKYKVPHAATSGQGMGTE
jgi:hypothetical protein